MNFSSGHTDTTEIRKVGEEDRILGAMELCCTKNPRICGRSRVSVPSAFLSGTGAGKGRVLVGEAPRGKLLVAQLMLYMRLTGCCLPPAIDSDK